MTRPKVPPDQRQRTAQACESCKRRKQKASPDPCCACPAVRAAVLPQPPPTSIATLDCNGLCPCNTCDKRKFICIYTDRDTSPDARPAPKRRAIDESDGDSPLLNHQSTANTPTNAQSHPSPLSPPSPRPTSELSTGAGAVQLPTSQLNAEHHHLVPSRATTANSGPEEEAVIYSQSRMLQDPTGRVLYIGDAATLSFLQLLRMMVETVAGPSPFTNDPRRHKIVEGQFSLPSGYRHTHMLPDLQTAHVLAQAFFVNTHGLLQVFERDAFMDHLNQCYADPLSEEPSWLCLLNLVFAIGLTMATPLSGSPEALIIDKLRSEHLDRAEVFYLNAKSLNDPMTGLEDQDFWAIQALLLMAVYMLAKSKRNTAFALLGMAARSAYALGLHREETMVIFSPQEQMSRKNLWRSVFVMDRLLSCSLGRPTAISEDDCSGDALHPSQDATEHSATPNPLHARPGFNDTGPCALQAAVRSCSVIGVILKKVYQQRKISTRLAQEIADICKSWPRALPDMLHWRQAATASPNQGVAILHVNLFYCHSIILLTRPFFLYILNLETQRQVGQSAARGPRPYLRMEKFSEACVIASTHTILLVQNALDAGHLSRRNPAVIYFLFAAALVILSNEYAGLYRVDASDTCIINAINIMSYCADSDQQASRLVYILTSYRDVVAQQRLRRKSSTTDNTTLPSISSQLYGAPMTDRQQASANVGGLGNSTDAIHATSHLHQVPIHIYPGMETAPVKSPTPMFRLNPAAQATEFSVRLSPMQEPPFDTATNALNTPLPKPPSLSTMLDLSALDGTRVPSLHSEESGQDEHIDFDALWAWPSNTPVTGSPRGEVGDKVQAIGDSIVPLFGVERNGRDA
ncbi:hypothetical protein ACEQ8H_005213 [Pleosporales sp. CAS-2024a]